MMGLDRKFLYGFLYGLLLALAATGVLLVVARRPPGRPVTLRDAPTPVPARVYVLGAVARPGVYPLPQDSILQDALAAAGGPSALADLAGLNLAQALADGDRVHVPEMTPTLTPAPPTPTSRPTVTVGPGTPTLTPAPTATALPATATRAAAALPGGRINLNTATLAELDRLPRIGPATAGRIIEYRTQHGLFQAPEDLMKVKGIGPATFEQLKDLVTVN
jgi:competence protein ComEA